MAWFNIVTGLVGGIGMFLYGMTLVSDGLQKTAGESLKKILQKLTSNRIVGTGVGIAVTVLLQSSTATTVMVVGFVNAGLMTLIQALSVILGANIGTTVTAQIIAFKVDVIALPAIGIGAIIFVFSKVEKNKYISEILLGFGLLFFGMTLMKNAFNPSSPEMSEMLRELFVRFNNYPPVVAVLIGTITTIVLQSSAAVVGITMALATSGLVDFPTAAALVLGDNIGTTITANLAALNSGKTAKQAAFGHFLFNAIGVIYILILFRPFLEIVSAFTPGDPMYLSPEGTYPYAARHIANTHTLFNIINTIVFLPILPLLAKLCEFLIKSDIKQKYQVTQLSNQIANTPEIAMQQVQREVVKMSTMTTKTLRTTENAIQNWDKSSMDKVEDYEQTLDAYKNEINQFVDVVEKKYLSNRNVESIKETRLIINDMEEIGDITQKIMRITLKMLDKNQELTDMGKKELIEMFETVMYFANRTFSALALFRPQTEGELMIEDEIDLMLKRFRKNHIRRLYENECDVELGIIFVEILSYLEKIGDHIYNIAQINVKRGANPQLHMTYNV